MNIEKYLVLNKYLLSLFGVSEFRELQTKLKDAPIGIDSDGRSHFVNILRSGFENIKIPEDTLLEYDSNIQSYIRKISFRRGPISLKYFQYLAVLFTEIVLDNIKNKKAKFLYELNEFLEKYKREQEIEIIDTFTEDDLKKLAFWMATGSGKTLIAHINYHQFFHDNYKLFSPDNIIFITPNEGLSKQHFKELQKSGIPARLYDGSLSNGPKNENEVLVIEITKLVEEKKSRGVTRQVDEFKGRNLVFVDEGHKGKKSDKEEQKWARLRNKLAENGFVFEYSATFGQILQIPKEEKKRKKTSTKSKPDEGINTLQEYAKSIIFDYSYKYFYLDGYGKDFSVINVKPGKVTDTEFSEVMFVANLLSFYEQLLAYKENERLAKEYNIGKPLWIFVGTTVTGKGDESDVIQIVKFLKKVITDESWVKDWVDKILNGKTALKDEKDKDVFTDRFKYLRKKQIDFEDLYKRVFGGRGSLKVYELKNAEGELGLKVGENEYFGVINIGGVSGFKKQLEEEGFTIEADAVTASLFDAIKRENSKINILIGSKKFIEGWDTWRVSSMGLLNIGKGQGPQIIQLFGRGVRLKGKGMSLKRSDESGLKEGEKEIIRCLETLNIYSIKADYLSEFLEVIKNEDVEFEEIKIPVKPLHKEEWGKLIVPLLKEGRKFEEEEVIQLKVDDKISVTLDLIPKVSAFVSEKREELKAKEIKPGIEEQVFPREYIELLDWERIFQEILEFKNSQGFWNLVLNIEDIKKLLRGRCKIKILPEFLDLRNEDDIKRLEEIAIQLIKKYLDSFYGKRAKKFETENLEYKSVEGIKQLSSFIANTTDEVEYYTISIDKSKKPLIEEVKKLVNDLNKLLEEEDEILPRVHFDRHLYVPILLKSGNIDRISPPGLEKSEAKFVKELKEYLKRNKEKFSNLEIYLLRNPSPSGIGFQLEWEKFYPDFIIWVKSKNRQAVVFIDPKGLMHDRNLDNEKINLSKELEEKIGPSLRRDDIFLTSFIISSTKFNDFIKDQSNPPTLEQCTEKNLLFFDQEYDGKSWYGILFEKVLKGIGSDKKD